MSQRAGINKRIADRLLAEGFLDDGEHMRVVEWCKRKNVRVEEGLIELHIMAEAKLLKYIATLHKTQFVSTERMSKAKVDRAALKAVSFKLAQHFNIYPLVLDPKNDKLIIATADPDDMVASKELQMATRIGRVQPMVARPGAVQAAIARGYQGDKTGFKKLMARDVPDLRSMGDEDDPFGKKARNKKEQRARRRTGRQAGEESRERFVPPKRDRAGRGAAAQLGTGEFPDLDEDLDQLDEPVERAPRRRTGEAKRRTGEGRRRTGEGRRTPYQAPPPDEYGDDYGEPEFYDPEPTPDLGSQRLPRRGYDDYRPPAPSEDGTDPGYRDPNEARRNRPGEYDDMTDTGQRREPPPRPYDARGAQPDRYPPPPRAPQPPPDGGYAYHQNPDGGRDRDVLPMPPRKHHSIMPPMRKLSHAAMTFGPLSTRKELADDAPSSVTVLTSASAFTESLRVLVGLLENERPDLRGHSNAVARFALDVCERISMSREQLVAVTLAGYLHDLGKMAGQHLTALNVALHEDHRQAAQKLWAIPEKLMESVGIPEQTVRALATMYEQINGRGIPEGLAGKDIPMGARILAVVDSYADLTRNPNNAHGQLLSPDQAVALLREHVGTVFDGNIVEVLEKSTSGERILTDLLADRHRVLIADPDPEETMVLQLRLAEQGFDVHVTRNLEEAATALTNQEFALVVSEVDLDKKGDGFELRKRVGRGKHVSWVFLSSSDSRDTAQRAFKMGVDDFLTKPVATEIVVAKLMQLVEKSSKKVAPRGVSGSLSEMGLPDIVQVLWHGRKTCALVITSGGASGEIHFSEGRIVDAKWGDAGGDTAFYRLLALGEDGEFSVDPEFAPSGEPVIQHSPEGLLLEGMRLMDEGKIP